LRGYVKINVLQKAPDKVVSTKIPELEIEFVDSSPERA